MQRQKIVIAIAIVVIVIIAGSVGVIYLNSGSSGTNPQPSPTPQLSVREQVRDAAISYMQTNHSGTAQFLTNLSWTGGRQDTGGMVGAETYIYNSTNWAVIIKYPVVLNPIYTVNATYCSGNTTIEWDGTYTNGTVTETNYAVSP